MIDNLCECKNKIMNSIRIEFALAQNKCVPNGFR